MFKPKSKIRAKIELWWDWFIVAFVIGIFILMAFGIPKDDRSDTDIFMDKVMNNYAAERHQNFRTLLYLIPGGAAFGVGYIIFQELKLKIKKRFNK